MPRDVRCVVGVKGAFRLLALLALMVGLAGGAAWAQTQYRLHTPKTKQVPKKTSTVQSERQDSTRATTPVRSSETRTKTDKGEVGRQVVETPGVNGDYESLVETEEETVEVDPQTTRVLRRLFARDPDGGRRVIEVTEEEHRKLPGNALRVVRSTSKPDLSGHFQLTRREVEESTQLSGKKRQTRTTVLQPDVNGGLSPAQQITETQEEKGAGVTLVERTHLLPDGNDRWEPYETRTRLIRSQGSEVKTEEQVYRKDAYRKLSLTERTLTREWKDAKGEEHQTLETYSNNIGGTTRTGDNRLVLDRRVSTVRRTLPDGSQQTTQEFEQRSTVAPSEPLRVTEKTLEFSRPVGQQEKQTQRTVRTLDAHGRYRTTLVLQSREPNP